MFNQDDIAGLESMGFKPEDIKKLLGLNKEKFKELMPKKPRKHRATQAPGTPTIPTPRRNEMVPMLFVYNCGLCGNVIEKQKEVLLTTVTSYKVEYINRHRVVQQKVSSCKHCRTYLSAKTKTELIDMMLGAKTIVPCIPDMRHIKDEDDPIKEVEQQLMLKLWDKLESTPPITSYPIVLVSDQNRWTHKAIKGFIELI